jgi:uncharacterized protein
VLIKLIIWGVLLVLVYRAAKTWLGGSASSRQDHVDSHNPNQVDDVMIKDPVCGAYFPKRNAVTLNKGGRTIHFCSTECRDRYIDDNKTVD